MLVSKPLLSRRLTLATSIFSHPTECLKIARQFRSSLATRAGTPPPAVRRRSVRSPNGAKGPDPILDALKPAQIGVGRHVVGNAQNHPAGVAEFAEGLIEVRLERRVAHRIPGKSDGA